MQMSQASQESNNGNRLKMSLFQGQAVNGVSGVSNSFQQISSGNLGNANVGGKTAVFSVEQNKQSQFSNQHSQTSQSQLTKNVIRGQDNIYTQTAISHQTRSQSTSSNSQKIHYKITHTVPYKQPVPVELIKSSVTSADTLNTYIPPHTAGSSYRFTPTPASKQIFTYPAVSVQAVHCTV